MTMPSPVDESLSAGASPAAPSSDGGWRRALRGGALAAAFVIIIAAVFWIVRTTGIEPVRAGSAAPLTLGTTDAAPALPDAPTAAAATGTTGAGEGASRNTLRVDPVWLADMATATGIPPRALSAYALAAHALATEQPTCSIGWNTLAGIGYIESGHGTHNGATVAEDGWVHPRILGAPLDGNGVAAIGDTDGGAWDGDTVWDRAVGPMQFIPDTWKRWGADANGDGVADPNHIDDAALAAARYLCASGEMTSTEGWRGAIFSYNHLTEYVDDVAATANMYADGARRRG